MTQPLRLVPDASLRHLNTFGVDARAGLLVELGDERYVDQAIQACGPDGPELVLGGGSNLLLTRSIEGAVLRMTGSGIQVVERGATSVDVDVLGGTSWHELVLWTLANGLNGLENLALIPGTVGAAPIQNIGAYGVELGERLTGVSAVNLKSGERRTFTLEECALGYRTSVFKQTEFAPWLITRVRLRLARDGSPKAEYGEIGAELASRGIHTPRPQDIAEVVISIRRRKLPDPRSLGNAGSFFKNPIVAAGIRDELLRRHPGMPHYGADLLRTGSGPHVRRSAGEHLDSPAMSKLSAAWLIEQCGWKGFRAADAGVYSGHSLILVNHGNATGLQILELANRIADSVVGRFGIRLQIEPRVI